MALNDRKGGAVARIRVNPKDCLGILEVVEAVGLDPYQYSFAGCVSVALSTLISSARKAGQISREEDGFQYLNRMETFLGQASTRLKRERTNQFYERAQGDNAQPLTPLKNGDFIPIHDPFDRDAGMREYEELKEKFDGNPESEIGARFLFLQDKLF